MNIELKYDPRFQRAARSRAASLAAAILISAALTVSCAGGGPPKAPEPPAQVDGEPAPDCLTVQPCNPYPCPSGARWDLANKVLPTISKETRYGGETCPKYYILDLQNSAERPQGDVDLRIAPNTQPRPCEASQLHVHVYGHSGSGWTKIPALTKSLEPITLQGQCALSDYREVFAGMPEFDRFRVLVTGVTGSGEQLPLALTLDKASP